MPEPRAESQTSDAQLPRQEWPLLADITAGSLVDERFCIVELIGAGGMSVIYKARQLPMERMVALKFLAIDRNDARAVQRFVREATATSQMDHANIVKVHAFGVSACGPYMAMEFLEGRTLAACLAQGPLPETEARNLFAEIGSALAHAHERGVVHRDVKPANVMLVESETGGKQAKLLDFGLARMITGDGADAQRLTQTGKIMGSLAYMSTEQCQGKPADARSDIYSFGCLMYETLTGQAAFAGESAFEILQEKMAPDAKRLLSALEPCSARMRDVVLKAMAPEPQERWTSVDAMLKALDLRQSTTSWRWYRQNIAGQKRAWLSLVVALVAGVIAFAMIAAAGSWLERAPQKKLLRGGLAIHRDIDRLGKLPDAQAEPRLMALFPEIDGENVDHQPLWNLRSKLCLELGYLAIRRRRLDVALGLFDQAEQAARKPGATMDMFDRGQALLQQAIILTHVGKYAESDAKIKAAIETSERARAIHEKAGAIAIGDYVFQQAINYRQWGKWQLAEATFQRSKEINRLLPENKVKELNAVGCEIILYDEMFKDPQVSGQEKARVAAKREKLMIRHGELEKDLLKSVKH